MLSISLPGVVEDQGSGNQLRVSKVTLIWNGPFKILTKGQLGSNLCLTHYTDSSTKKHVGTFNAQGIHIGKDNPFPLPILAIDGGVH